MSFLSSANIWKKLIALFYLYIFFPGDFYFQQLLLNPPLCSIKKEITIRQCKTRKKSIESVTCITSHAILNYALILSPHNPGLKLFLFEFLELTTRLPRYVDYIYYFILISCNCGHFCAFAHVSCAYGILIVDNYNKIKIFHHFSTGLLTGLGFFWFDRRKCDFQMQSTRYKTLVIKVKQQVLRLQLPTIFRNSNCGFCTTCKALY